MINPVKKLSFYKANTFHEMGSVKVSVQMVISEIDKILLKAK